MVENAKALAQALIGRGFAIVSGGTDTHLMLVDLRPKNLTGKVAEKTLDQAGITVNKNTIPDDPQSPFVTSGIRLGTPALTTRGMGPGEMERIAELIDRALTRPDEALPASGRRSKSSARPFRSINRSRRPVASAGAPECWRPSLPRVSGERAAVRRRRDGAHPSEGGAYHERAYLFVLATIEYLQSRLEVRRHVSGAELAWACATSPGRSSASRRTCSATGASPGPRISAGWCSPWWRSGCS